MALFSLPGAASRRPRENGDFLDPALPPIELPTRLCVESRVQFHRAMRVGDAICALRSRIVDIAEKQRANRADRVRSRFAMNRAIPKASRSRRIGALYNGARRAAAGVRTPRGIRGQTRCGRGEFRADPVTLCSAIPALTFDTNRIHYDRPFATFVEGHPGLVVQSGLVG